MACRLEVVGAGLVQKAKARHRGLLCLALERHRQGQFLRAGVVTLDPGPGAGFTAPGPPSFIASVNSSSQITLQPAVLKALYMLELVASLRFRGSW